jgi:hypothetical protein
MNATESIINVLSTLDQRAILCDLPDGIFEWGGTIHKACAIAGYDESGRQAINQINGWNMTVAQLAGYLTQPVEA